MGKGIAIGIVIFLLALGGGYSYRHPIKEYFTGSQAQALLEARKLIDQGEPRQALAVLRPYARNLTEDSSLAQQWRALFLEAAIAAKDSGVVTALYEKDPHLLDNNEEATLLAADFLIKTNRPLEYDQLRQEWKGHETKEDIWFNLDADKLLLEGNRAAAIQLLSSHEFESKADTGRLVRLALLSIKENPKAAWEYLATAYAKDPENPEIRSYRARLLEVVGQTGLAMNEYIGAVQAAPKQLIYKDQLAEFYRRHNRYDLAIEVWKEGLNEPEADYLWLKAWFWSRIVLPFGIQWENYKPPEGRLGPFLKYLAGLKPGQFWDQTAFEKLPDAQSYLESQQVTFWLRLLNACQQHNESGAWELLQYNTFAGQSWNPDLETLLRKVLTYRKIGTFYIDAAAPGAALAEEVPTAPNKNKLTHPLFVEVESSSVRGADAGKMTPAVKELLTSDLAISSCFLIVGWLEAALDLAPQPIAIPEDMPEWLAFDYAQAIRAVNGVPAALEFAKKQKPSPSLRMLIGELLIASGDRDAGAEKLRELSAIDSDVGFRSAWLLSLLYLEKKQYDQARAVIKSLPRLANHSLGKESLARIALFEGNQDEAEKLYRELEATSWEAKSFLARKAFQDKDYKHALELTEALLRQFPANTVLRENYQRVQEELKKQQAGSSVVEVNHKAEVKTDSGVDESAEDKEGHE